MSRNVNQKNRRIKDGFLALPHPVLNSPAYRALSPKAVKLLVDIGSQYKGRNNGDLAACMSIMSPKGWRSETTMRSALNELLQHGLIEQTRQGGFNAGPNLYALTWQSIDECETSYGRSRHDARPTKVPSGKWKDYPGVANAA